MDRGWEQFHDLNHMKGMCILGFINHQEFITADWRGDTLYRYNVGTNKCKKLLDLPTDYELTEGGPAYDSQKQLFYLLHYGSLLTHNFKTNTSKSVTGVVDTDQFPVTIVAKNTFHVFGGDSNNSHLIWDTKKEKFSHIHAFNDLTENGIIGSKLIYVKSRNSLLLIGGSDAKSYALFDSVFEYSFDSNKWNKLKLNSPNPMYDFGHAISRNDQYILIFAPYIPTPTDEVHRYDRSDSIYVLDITRMIFGESKIKCPAIDSFYERVWIENDYKKEELITAGYIKNIWKQEQNFSIDYLPQYLVSLVQSFYAIDYVHAIHKTGHWKISLEHVINNTDFDIV